MHILKSSTASATPLATNRAGCWEVGVTGSEGKGATGNLPAIVPELLPALLAHPAAVEQIQMALAGVQD